MCLFRCTAISYAEPRQCFIRSPGDHACPYGSIALLPLLSPGHWVIFGCVLVEAFVVLYHVAAFLWLCPRGPRGGVLVENVCGRMSAHPATAASVALCHLMSCIRCMHDLRVPDADKVMYEVCA